MPYLTNQVRNLLAPAAGPHPERGSTVPTSNQNPFLQAACWAWALVGTNEASDNPFSAPTIYSADAGAFTYDNQRRPTGLNANFFAQTNEIFPATQPFHQVLTTDFAAALGGNVAAQGRCRIALLKLTAIANGHTVLPDNGSQVYTLAMKSNSWYGWDHWAIGVQATSGNTITYQQKVNGEALQYNCGVVWDPANWPVTSIRIDGLLQAQVDMLAHVAAVGV